MFPVDIRGIIRVDRLIIVFIYAYTQEEMEKLPTTNVYAYDENANLVWEIAEPPQGSNSPVSYADIILREDGAIVAGSTRGDEYIVNVKDGSVEHIKGQRPW